LRFFAKYVTCKAELALLGTVAGALFRRAGRRARLRPQRSMAAMPTTVPAALTAAGASATSSCWRRERTPASARMCGV